jgi:tellurite resistance protein TehA-like permease
MSGGMSLNTPTPTLLVAIAIIVVCCLAFPKVRRKLLGVVATRDGIRYLLYIVVGLAFVLMGSWALDRTEVSEQLIVGLGFLILGIAIMVVGRIDIGASEDLTGLPARLLGLASVIMSLALLLPLAVG